MGVRAPSSSSSSSEEHARTSAAVAVQLWTTCTLHRKKLARASNRDASFSSTIESLGVCSQRSSNCHTPCLRLRRSGAGSDARARLARERSSYALLAVVCASDRRVERESHEVQTADPMASTLEMPIREEDESDARYARLSAPGEPSGLAALLCPCLRRAPA